MNNEIGSWNKALHHSVGFAVHAEAPREGASGGEHSDAFALVDGQEAGRGEIGDDRSDRRGGDDGGATFRRGVAGSSQENWNPRGVPSAGVVESHHGGGGRGGRLDVRGEPRGHRGTLGHPRIAREPRGAAVPAPVVRHRHRHLALRGGSGFTVALLDDREELEAFDESPEETTVGVRGPEQEGRVGVEALEDVLLQHHVAQPAVEGSQSGKHKL
ncbi:hypothetical protein L596_007785 [Steinernema carpocapsae]|uniref:Uncharacterized protein n=1 Tax=Steinernema carpocapsae TaxID=34508 RepID=A0A4U5PAH5_STECR|nr:hypothetical protein L596_007785 [Steinernema carpocapsae]